jgi:CBS domain containing-hemolysin-like protein
MSEGTWLLVEGLLFLLALLASGFFSAAETALTSISAVRINQIAGKQNERHPLFDWLKHPARYLTTLLVGNNIVNIAAALLAGDFCQRLLRMAYPGSSNTEAWAAGLAFIVTTTLVLIFAEIIPKTYSRHHHETIAPRVARPINLVYKILKYPIRLFMTVSNMLIRLFGGETSSEIPFVTSEDLKLMIEVGERQGLLDLDEREMLHSIFELSETPVREVMTPRVDMIYVKVTDALDAVLRKFEEHGFSRMPVIDDNRDNIVGIINMRDLLHQLQRGAESEDVVRRLMRPCLFVPETKRVDDVLKQFQREKTHMAIVVDEYGGTAGLVTIEDILEEIVGEIQDEFDEEEPEIVSDGHGVWIVDATVHPEDIEDELGMEWPSGAEDYDSLAGLLLERVGDLPKEGDVVDFGSLRFTILEANERRITKVRIEKHSPEEKPAEDATAS